MGITAGAAYVAPWAGVVIGAIAVPFMMVTNHLVERKLKVDDVVAVLTFRLIKKTIGLRASREEELQGLDIPEHGIEAYPAPNDPSMPLGVAARPAQLDAGPGGE